MRWGWSLLTMAAFAVAALAADEPQNLTLLSCPQAAASDACNPSKADLKKSKTAFSKALKLQKAEHFDEAYQEFDTAARLVPKNVEYVTALAMVRQQLVYDHLHQGNDDLTKGKLVEAQAEFRSAANLDPQNEFAKQRLQDSMAEWAPKRSETPRVVESVEVRVVPNAALHEFHFRGDSHALLTQVAAAYGVAAEFDESVPTRRVHFDMESVDFYTAMRSVCSVTGAFWVPLSEKQIYLVRDNSEKPSSIRPHGVAHFLYARSFDAARDDGNDHPAADHLRHPLRFAATTKWDAFCARPVPCAGCGHPIVRELRSLASAGHARDSGL